MSATLDEGPILTLIADMPLRCGGRRELPFGQLMRTSPPNPLRRCASDSLAIREPIGSSTGTKVHFQKPKVSKLSIFRLKHLSQLRGNALQS